MTSPTTQPEAPDEVNEALWHVVTTTPLFNGSPVVNAMGKPLPPHIGGSCLVQAKRLVRALEQLPSVEEAGVMTTLERGHHAVGCQIQNTPFSFILDPSLQQRRAIPFAIRCLARTEALPHIGGRPCTITTWGMVDQTVGLNKYMPNGKEVRGFLLGSKIMEPARFSDDPAEL